MMPRLSRRALLRALVATLATGPAARSAAQRAAQDPVWPDAQWPRATPESQGLDPAAVERLFAQIVQPGRHVDSVLLVRHGHIVAELDVAPYDGSLVHDLRSVTKSVLGTLVGVALQRGDLRTLDQRVAALLPGAPVPADPRWRQLAITHLLDMRTGIDWREWPYDARSDTVRMASSPDWLRYILARPMRDAPGARFHYTGAAPHLLSAILGQATGQNAAAYARARLFAPLGIDHFNWRADRHGRTDGESGLSLRPQDIARIGLLLLRDGRWHTQQLLPAGWLRSRIASAQAHGIAGLSPPLPTHYGGLWWVDPQLPMAQGSGRHGQHLVLLPQHDLLLVVTGKGDDRPGEVPDLAAWMPPLLRPSAAAPALALAHLRQRLGVLSLPPALAGMATSPRASAVSGRRWRFGNNTHNLAALAVHVDGGGRARLAMWWHDSSQPQGEALFERPFGTEGAYARTGVTPWGIFASRGAWQDADTLVIESEALQAASVTTLQLRFGANHLVLTITDSDTGVVRLVGRP